MADFSKWAENRRGKGKDVNLNVIRTGRSLDALSCLIPEVCVLCPA